MRLPWKKNRAPAAVEDGRSLFYGARRAPRPGEAAQEPPAPVLAPAAGADAIERTAAGLPIAPAALREDLARTVDQLTTGETAFLWQSPSIATDGSIWVSPSDWVKEKPTALCNFKVTRLADGLRLEQIKSCRLGSGTHTAKQFQRIKYLPVTEFKPL